MNKNNSTQQQCHAWSVVIINSESFHEDLVEFVVEFSALVCGDYSWDSHNAEKLGKNVTSNVHYYANTVTSRRACATFTFLCGESLSPGEFCKVIRYRQNKTITSP